MPKHITDSFRAPIPANVQMNKSEQRRGTILLTQMRLGCTMHQHHSFAPSTALPAPNVDVYGAGTCRCDWVFTKRGSFPAKNDRERFAQLLVLPLRSRVFCTFRRAMRIRRTLVVDIFSISIAGSVKLSAPKKRTAALSSHGAEGSSRAWQYAHCCQSPPRAVPVSGS